MTPAPPPAGHALLVDDDEIFRHRLAVALQRRGWLVHQAAHAAQALAAATQHDLQLVVVDLRLADRSGLELLEPLLQARPDACVLMLTGYGSIATAIQATRLGAHHYLSKPADAEQILQAYARFLDPEPDPALPGDPPVPSLGRVEWEHIQRVLADCGGNITQAARLLGLHRRSLQRKLLKRPPAV